MGKVFDGIGDHLRGWIGRQRLFFVGSAPLAADGHINVSPKGPIDSLAVLDEHTVAYLDIVGSGAETIAHLRENGRIVVMLCAFEGPPKIVRLYGRASVVLPDDPGFAALAGAFDPPEHAVRSVVRIEVERIADSCGYGVPLMRFDGRRDQYDAWVDKQARDGGFDAYIAKKNAQSIDGLPAL